MRPHFNCSRKGADGEASCVPIAVMGHRGISRFKTDIPAALSRVLELAYQVRVGVLYIRARASV